MENITGRTSQKSAEVYRDGRYTNEWGQLVFTQCTRGPLPVPLPTILSPTPYEWWQPTKRWKEPSASTWSRPSQRCSTRIWAWWAQISYLGRVRHTFLWVVSSQTLELQDPHWLWFVIVRPLSWNSFEFVSAQACCIFPRRWPLSFTRRYKSTLPDCARYSSPTDSFFTGSWRHYSSPSGQVSDKSWGSSFECAMSCHHHQMRPDLLTAFLNTRTHHTCAHVVSRSSPTTRDSSCTAVHQRLQWTKSRSVWRFYRQSNSTHEDTHSCSVHCRVLHDHRHVLRELLHMERAAFPTWTAVVLRLKRLECPKENPPMLQCEHPMSLRRDWRPFFFGTVRALRSIFHSGLPTRPCTGATAHWRKHAHTHMCGRLVKWKTRAREAAEDNLQRRYILRSALVNLPRTAVENLQTLSHSPFTTTAHVTWQQYVLHG